MNERDTLLREVSQAEFSVIELNLFLDTHPNNFKALLTLKEMERNLRAIKKDFCEKYGPLQMSSKNGQTFKWISSPWPWENRTKGDKNKECGYTKKN